MARTYECPYSLEIPVQDVASFIFTAGTPESRRQPQYFDAEKPERNYSLQQAEIWVRRIAKGLQDLGLQADDKVFLCSANSLYFPVLLWAVMASGCVFKIAYQLNDCDAELVLANAASMAKVQEAVRKVGRPGLRVYEFTEPDIPESAGSGVTPWTDFWASESRISGWDWPKLDTKEKAMAKTAVVNYSSGTTGLPKGVELSHYNLISNSAQNLFKRQLVADTPAGLARKSRLDSAGERWLAPFPMFHAYGQNYYCLNAARCGAKVFVMGKYDLERWLTYLDIYRINFLTGTPTVFASLTKYPHPEKFNLKAVESVISGSAPLNAEIGQLVAKRYLRPGIVVKQGWGMTESTCTATGFAQDDEDDGASIGWLSPNMSAKIVPIPGRDFGPSEVTKRYPVGEIWLTGPNIMKGYYKKPRETAATIVNEDGKRWLRTGDIGYVNDQGRFYIIDRLKELIKVKGFQVAPAEIEQTLLLHPSVADAAVVGFKMNNGEYPKGYVVKKEQAPDVTAEELQAFIKARLSKVKWLTAGVEFINAIPRNNTGKIERRKLNSGGGSSMAPKL
ncbi:hypothetical protein Z517_08383 [Fonsecaea pedrosoi CBS 271.37]|uniref:AMP-dependent synthetase/ligase domain-containing protein n=1 Tax=Fonsecaea pedrosoi CBS 271.37 TaxID=1442368 RepID=A0A0D2GJ61_9EURO|nr:uncharacterized protein Z517_08383 [Fonsecaea pedrosoi CBS 271.37]KIW78545.1 hypothetical protein Z517_08383 [Fonsecaea pedrosoi CBS 271.37]